jgi:hypothetical protein
MLTIEQAQSIADLRQRMLNNLSQGKPAQEGISQEEIRQGLEWLRQNRAVAGAKGGKAKAKKSEADLSGPATPEAASSLNDKLKALGLDLD